MIQGDGLPSRPLGPTIVGLGLLLVLAGCAAPTPGELGVEDGYRYNDTVAVDGSDGLNGSEQSAVVSRAMARIERLRDLEFRRSVSVTVVSRAEYRSNRSSPETDTPFSKWKDQVWEALFLVGEDDSYAAAQDRTLGSQVLGYYSPDRRAIVLVSDDPEPRVARSTLVHELVHALQDQHFGFPSGTETQDTELAGRSVIEGEANHLERLYERRCDGSWDCVRVGETAEGGGTAGGGGPVNRGVLQVILQPYQTGPDFVDAIHSRRGWSGVNDLHDRLPDTTTEVIHPDRYPDAEPAGVAVADRSSDDWSRFDLDQVSDTVGEASIFVMFSDNGVLPDDVGRFSYRSEASAGWAGDAVVPYRNGDRYGYVWETRWNSPGDARQFLDAYETLLASHDATDRGDGVYVLPESDPYGDAFRVRRDGRSVRIVNAPSVADLSAVHEPLSAE